MCIQIKRFLDQPEIKAFKILSWTIDPDSKRPILLSPLTRTLLSPYKKLKAYHAEGKAYPKLLDKSQYFLPHFDYGWTALKDPEICSPYAILKAFGDPAFLDSDIYGIAIARVTLQASEDQPITLGRWGTAQALKAPYMRCDHYIRSQSFKVEGGKPFKGDEYIYRTIKRCYQEWGPFWGGALYPVV